MLEKEHSYLSQYLKTNNVAISRIAEILAKELLKKRVIDKSVINADSSYTYNATINFKFLVLKNPRKYLV